MQQRIRSLLALAQLTSLVVARSSATQQMFASASYNISQPLYPNQYMHQQPNVPAAVPGFTSGVHQSLAEINNQQLVKELLPFITLPSMNAGQGQQLGIEDLDRVDWTSLEQDLLDQAFPDATDAQRIDLEGKTLVITSRTAPISYSLNGLNHIYWSTELGNQLPYTFTVNEQQSAV